jgi:hypothetical protein
MEFKDVKAFIEQNKDNDEVKNYLAGLSKTTPEGVKEYLDSDDGKKMLQPVLDKYHAKGLESWKQNNLPKLIDEEFAKRNPAETEEQKALRKLQADLDNEKQARVRETLRNKAITHATQKNLPIDLVDYFVAQDEDSTIANLGKFESAWQKNLQTAVEDKFKGSGRAPHIDRATPQGSLYTPEQLRTLTSAEVNANWDKVQASLAVHK